MDKILTYNNLTRTAVMNISGAKLVEFLNSVDTNNTFIPGIDRIIYNLGKKAYPKRGADGHKIKDSNGKLVMSEPMDVLTTVVFFKDNTKVVVTNNEHDGIELETKTIADGINVKVASEHSKEIGLMYAIVKRALGRPDENGTIMPNGFINKIQNLVHNGYDSRLEAAKKAHNDKLAKEAAKQKAAEPKTKNPSLAETARCLADSTAKLADAVNKLVK